MQGSIFKVSLVLLGLVLASAHGAIWQQGKSPGSFLPVLPRLSKVDKDGISISGLSSGADFASNFQLAFSKTVMGLGVFAGQAPHCAVTRFPNETIYPISNPITCGVCDGCPASFSVQCDHCKAHPENVDITVLREKVEKLANMGLVDDLSNLERARVYTYCGTNDSGHYVSLHHKETERKSSRREVDTHRA